MGTSILGIGQSALAAAQAGIATTGHNIANANTPGYSRQILMQSSASAQGDGGNFVGQGTKIGDISRVYNQFISQQVNRSQSTQNFASTYFGQISQISNLVADQAAGVSPALQDFFSAIQNLATSPSGTAGAAARQSVLSAGEALASRFQSVATRLDQLSDDVSSRITEAVSNINLYAKQISDLNDTIETAESVSGGAVPNDLLDQRDLAVTNLSKLVNVSVVDQNGKYNLFMGTGQPLVLGNKVNVLQATSSLTDPSRLEVSYENNGKLVQLDEKSLNGGVLGGLFAFRLQSLDIARNSLGRIAVAVASEFNDQHKLGQDLNGSLGTNFFRIGQPSSTPSSANGSRANIDATIVDASKLTTSDYDIKYLGGTVAKPYQITRTSDGTVQSFASLPAIVDGVKFAVSSSSPVTVVPNKANLGSASASVTVTSAASLTGNEYEILFDGTGSNFTVVNKSTSATVQASTPYTSPQSISVDGFKVTLTDSPNPPGAGDRFSVAGPLAVGDEFLVRPTAAGATGISVAINDISKVAAGLPLSTNVPSTNLGTGKISLGNIASPLTGTSISTNGTIAITSVDDGFSAAGIGLPLSLTFGATPLVAPPLPAPQPTQAYTLSGFPAGALVTVNEGGVNKTYQIAAATNLTADPPRVTSLPYNLGDEISYGGANFKVNGTATPPSTGDTFTIGSTLPITPVKLTYNSVGQNFTGFPATANVTVKNGSVTTSYPAGSPSIPYIEGSTISFNGQSFVVSGAFANGDVINIAQNPNGSADNRNAANLATLQTKNTMAGGTATFQGSYGQLVSAVGNKAHELDITNSAETQLLNQAVQAQQSESGVNLDEEAANLLRYQQAYQAAGKLMQIASQLFQQLLQIGQ
jgi:flagellar hook-associated protein 1 FlgK